MERKTGLRLLTSAAFLGLSLLSGGRPPEINFAAETKGVSEITSKRLVERYHALPELTPQPLIPPVNLQSATPIPRKFTPEDSLAALVNASPLLRCAVDVEVAGVGYDPYAEGKEGELGIGQLHPKGKLITFYKNGYTNPFDPYQVVDFMGEQFALGDANHWAGVRDGYCKPTPGNP